MIYFLQHREDHYIKIGSTANLAVRLAQLREHYGKEHITLLGIMDGTKEAERRFHLQFAHLQRFGEWFRPGADLLAFIQENAHPFVLSEGERRKEALAQAYEKQRRMRRLYYAHPEGLSDSELAAHLDISRMTVYRYRQQLQAVRVQPGRYSLIPSADEITEALHLLKVAVSSSLISPHSIVHAISPAASSQNS